MKNHKAFFTFAALAFSLNTLIVAQTDTLPKGKTTFGVAFGYTQGYYKIKKANWVSNGFFKNALKTRPFLLSPFIKSAF